jgi:hypothetical protein
METQKRLFFGVAFLLIVVPSVVLKEKERVSLKYNNKKKRDVFSMYLVL